MAATTEMINFAIENLPYACCIVPEKRQEITTEGGLDINSNIKNLNLISEKISKTEIFKSFKNYFSDAELIDIKSSKEDDK